MYTFLVDKDNYIVTTHSERIVQRTKLANTICIYALNNYGDMAIQNCQTILYYRLPVSQEWKSLFITPSEDLYKDKYVQYLIPVDTWLTHEAGDVEFELRFYNVEMGGELNIDQYLRKATDGIIHISSSKDWASGIADSLLDTVDQRIIQVMMAQKRQDELIEETQSRCASSLLVEDSKLYLVDANGNKKGQPADIVVPSVPDNKDGENDGIIDIDNIQDDTFLEL